MDTRRVRAADINFSAKPQDEKAGESGVSVTIPKKGEFQPGPLKIVRTADRNKREVAPVISIRRKETIETGIQDINNALDEDNLKRWDTILGSEGTSLVKGTPATKVRSARPPEFYPPVTRDQFVKTKPDTLPSYTDPLVEEEMSLGNEDIMPLSRAEVERVGGINADLLSESQIKELNIGNTKEAIPGVRKGLRKDFLDRTSVSKLRNENVVSVFDPKTADVLDLVDLDPDMFSKLAPSEVQAILKRSNFLRDNLDKKTLSDFSKGTNLDSVNPKKVSVLDLMEMTPDTFAKLTLSEVRSVLLKDQLLRKAADTRSLEALKDLAGGYGSPKKTKGFSDYTDPNINNSTKLIASVPSAGVGSRVKSWLKKIFS